MPLVKCPYCQERTRPPAMPLHLHRCVRRRRALKIEQIKAVPEALEPTAPEVVEVPKKKIKKEKQ